MTLGGSDGSAHAPLAVPGKVIGPSFAASEITDAVEAILDTYRELRQPDEKFIDALHRIGLDPFKAAANAQRTATARA